MPKVPLVLALGLLASLGCNGDPKGDEADETMGSETMGTDDTTGDGDGDTSSSDDDTTETSEEGGCTTIGCECDGTPESCSAGLSCIDGTCQSASCGNGSVEGLEECDDGNDVDGDGCDNECTFTAIVQVEAGIHHTCVLIEGGRVRCWGRGEFGQLGRGDANNVGDDELPSDLGDAVLPGPVIALSLGGQHTCATFEDGALRCWGANERGQLGYGNLANQGDDESLAGLGAIGVPPVIEVHAGAAHTCARVGNGQIRCWGRNDAGELGYANTLVPTPEMLLPGGNVDIAGAASALELGWYHACVRMIDGGIRCWGYGDSGRLGYANASVNIGDDEAPSAVGLVSAIPIGLPANSEYVDTALGGNHSCALFGGGEVVCWGANASGQLGQGNVNVVGDDEAPSSLLPVMLPEPAVEIAAGGSHTCARLVSGDVTCWGDNSVGQLGLGNIDNVGDDEVPTAVTPIDLGGQAKRITVGGNHSCALLTSNEVVCWGQNNYSQLGLGSSVTVGDNETPAESGPTSIF